MFGLKLQTLGYLVLAFVLSTGGAFTAGRLTGYWKGKEDKTAEVERLQAIDFAKRVDKAFEIADAFITIGKNLQAAMSKRIETGHAISKAGVEHVAANPQIRDTGLLDDYLMELRRCAIDEVWRAAGDPLPSHRDGATCPPPVPDNKPSG